MINLAMLLPDELLPLLLVSAGLCLVLGLRALAISLATVAIAAPFIGVIAGALLDLLPWYLVLAVLAFAVLSMLRAGSNFLLGRAATDHVVGDLAADVVRFFLKLPFRLVGGALRLLWRLARPDGPR
jgi:ABC-type multidrug transport system fused ATPase/permease subunit